jgi:hypothetical protein
MQLSATQTKLALALIVFVVVLLAYYFWAQSARRATGPAPGQTIQNPLGSQMPGGTPGQAGNAPAGNLPPGMTLPQRGTPSNSMPFSEEQFRRMTNSRKTGP